MNDETVGGEDIWPSNVDSIDSQIRRKISDVEMRARNQCGER